MKCSIPEISWHNKDPVLSVDFQPKSDHTDALLRLASGGSDSHVLIWYVNYDENLAKIELAADLTRHQRAVNCVRWSPSGEYLASCDDESFVFIWRMKPEAETATIFDRDDGSQSDKETWLTYKTLRGHTEDVYDLSWSYDSQFLISGSVDNSAVIWDVHKAKSITKLVEHKGFVQGVAWDPLDKFIATLSTDRYLRFFDTQSKKIIQRINKLMLPVKPESPFHQKTIRMFHDDTLQTFFRRLCFSPDGNIIVVPAGIAEVEGSNMKPLNTTYIFTRNNLKTPSIILPSPDNFSVAIRFCPQLFKLRKSESEPIIPLPYRMIFAIATKSSLYFYDTQQKLPFALISNIHYTRLTDITWSSDGCTLMVSSTDGYCSIVQFAKGELGEIYSDETINEIINRSVVKNELEKQNKKKRKRKSRKHSALDKSIVNDDAMEVDEVSENISISNLPESIKEIIPVDKIIKSNEIFSPEKQIGTPVTPIQVRKFPRTVDDAMNETEKLTPTKDKSEVEEVKTPKSNFSFMTNKSPMPIEIRRQPRVVNPSTTPKPTNIDGDEWPKPLSSESPMDRKIPTPIENKTPKTPRRIELKTISTPKSKKKIL
ncbi:CLUMA_CG019620, isoform A [Clunio marinus]|uniref:CLUMA_CG019620, isoform A n=1 Tax=Clunio marinus TaxID=568069 RepID=A0A1J1J1W3_9DIPT|nr:CLUMA_CG019620, isoform A [Clunio marinus]